MEQEYIYGVARIRALESTMFSDEDIDRLIRCRDYQECISFLRDRGWGNSGDETLEEMLETEHGKTRQVLDDIVKDKKDCRILTVTDEFHNLKAAIKSVCTGREKEKIFIPGTGVSPEFLKECIRKGDFSGLPEDMIDAAKEATDVLLRQGDGQMCDMIIDKATLKAIKKAGDDSDNIFIKDYANMQVAIADIKIAVRCAAAGKDGRFAGESMVSCPDISTRELADAVNRGQEGVCSYLESIGMEEGTQALKSSKSAFECWCDNRIMENIKAQKYESFTIGPVVAYVLARENEIKTVRIILSGKLNGFRDEFIRERVRVMYA